MTQPVQEDISKLSLAAFRNRVRKGEWTGSTHGICRGYAATDVVILPKAHAYDFLVFCNRNPKTCPVVDITDVGSPHPPTIAPEADLRTDLPKYRVYRDGRVIDEPTDIHQYWSDDLVAVLLGEAASFHWSWTAAGIQFESLGTFATTVPCVPYGPFHGNIAVSCKVFKNSSDAVRAVQIASRHPLFHGSPMHIGEPAAIGIKDLSNPDVILRPEKPAPKPPGPGEIALFWPCFGTVREIMANAGLPLAIVDYPLHNFITDSITEGMAAL